MICVKCGKSEITINGDNRQARGLFCPGCGWTGGILEVIDNLQMQIKLLKQELNDEKMRINGGFNTAK